MPRVTEYGPTRPHLTTGALGYDPGVPTGTIPDPIDYADDAAWFTPAASGSEAAFVQYKQGTVFGGATTAALDATPTPGNILVFCVQLRNSVGITVSMSGTGWSLIRDESIDGAGTSTAFMYWRVVKAGDGAAWSATRSAGSGDIEGWLLELQGVSTLDEDVGNGGFLGEPTIDIDPVTTDPVVIVSFAAVGTDSEIAFNPAADMTEIVDLVGVNGPQVAINHRVITSPAGPYTVGSPWGSAGADLTLIIAASFTSPSDVIWLPAFAVNDNDGATFDSSFEAAVAAADGVIVKGTITPAVVLVSATLRAGFEAAGSRTVTLEGAGEADFSDAVTIGSAAITALGSGTAQAISFDLPGSVGYNYLRFLTSVDEDVRVYEITLTAPDSETSHSHTHDHDDYYLTVRYGGGDALSTFVDIGATETIDLANGNVHQLTLDANCTLTFTGAAAGRARSFRLYLWQDDVGGHTVTWPGSVEWAGGAPTLDTTAETLSVFMFETLDGGTVWHGYAIGGGSSSTLRWEAVTDGEDVFVWSGDDLVHEFKEYV